ncbi:GFA family protein [Nitratireductor mangrovi]|uniref:GFA family protein n=1 Tax=Nitratireductor mangrovi TaxID=2599600 RepID=A0A5B8L588_9HYPH|nr:GFA family protein [Nitratireductor mangrovi]QDZ02870.1 GFA family protein [Nitratireductor mangrovi]
MTEALNGQCLCGELRFTATPTGTAMGICHCGMCRRWSGGTFMSTDCGDSVRFESEETLGRYRGSSWGERLFCTACGSTILWQTQDGKNQHVSVHTFDDAAAFRFASEIFIDRKPGNYDFANETRKMTEAEVFALYGPKSSEGVQ